MIITFILFFLIFLFCGWKALLVCSMGFILPLIYVLVKDYIENKDDEYVSITDILKYSNQTPLPKKEDEKVKKKRKKRKTRKKGEKNEKGEDKGKIKGR